MIQQPLWSQCPTILKIIEPSTAGNAFKLMVLCAMMITKIVKLLQLVHPTVHMEYVANQAILVSIATTMENILAVNLQMVRAMVFRMFLQTAKTTNFLPFAQALVTRKPVESVMMTKIWT